MPYRDSQGISGEWFGNLAFGAEPVIGPDKASFVLEQQLVASIGHGYVLLRSKPGLFLVSLALLFSDSENSSCRHSELFLRLSGAVGTPERKRNRSAPPGQFG